VENQYTNPFFSALFAKNFALFAVKNLRLTAKNAENAQSTQRIDLLGK